MEELRPRLSFSIASKPKPAKPAPRPVAFSAAAGPHRDPVPRFITAFDPALLLAPPATVIAPLPDSRRLSTVSIGGGPAFMPDDNASSSSSAGYGLAVRGDVEGFGAALLAGYGWKEGTPVGRNKSKGDPKVVELGRRSGTQGLGAEEQGRS